MQANSLEKYLQRSPRGYKTVGNFHGPLALPKSPVLVVEVKEIEGNEELRVY